MASLKAHIILHEREESLICTECGDEFGVQVRILPLADMPIGGLINK